MSKILTISVAAYNVENYLEKTLESCVVSNKFRELIEVIVVNDGSKDSTSEIAHRYEELYPSIFKVIDKKNGGYGSTINSSVKQASGKYFRLLDGDDWFNLTELEKFLLFLENVDSDLILNNYSIYNEKLEKTEERKIFTENFRKKLPISKLEVRKDWAMYSFCYRTDIMKDIIISEHCFYTDIEFLILPLLKCKTFSYTINNLYYYRIGRSEQSVSVEGMIKHYLDYQHVLEILFEQHDKYRELENVKEIIKNFLVIIEKKAITSFSFVITRNEISDLREYDNYLKSRNKEVYYMVSRESAYIYMLRKTCFRIYRFCRLCKQIIR